MVKSMKKKMKKIISSFMAVTMIAMCFVGFELNIKNINAADAVYTEQLNIEDYSSKVPVPTNADHKDWIFAGWYEDEQCEKYVADKSTATGTKYAKFVSEEVLSVKCQITDGTTATSPTTDIRFVTTVDSLYYKETGFTITVGGTERTQSIKTVYKKIVANDGGVKFEYEPTDFCASAKYFATFTITNLELGAYETGISIKPYWITMDGTKVEGVSRYARVEDSWRNIVNVPVRVHADAKVAAGKVSVLYDSTQYKYVGGEGDCGSIFDEIFVNDNGAGTITCIGNTYLADDRAADGLLANLRFEKIDDSTAKEVTFTVQGEQFADQNENFVYTDKTNNLFDVSNVVYKDINK